MARGVVPLEMAKHVHTQAPRAELDKQRLLIDETAKMVDAAADNADLQREWFTGDGKPIVNIIASRIGLPVNAAERDQAWEAYLLECED